MASLNLLPRLDPTTSGFTPVATDLAGTVQQQLGDLGTGSDGWDALFALPAGALELDVASLGDFDVLLAALDFNPGDVANTYFVPVDSAMPTFLANGDALNAVVQDPGTAGQPVTITPPASPPGGDNTGGGPPSGTGNPPPLPPDQGGPPYPGQLPEGW
jgi:hypothetical protein